MTLTITAEIPAGQPWVDVRAVTDAADDVPITITRTMQNTTRILRGGDAVIGHSGRLVIPDYEVMYRTPLDYRAQTGDGQHAGPATVEIPEDRAWLRSVLNPGSSTPIRIVEFGEASRDARTAYLEPVGRRTPIAVSDIRRGQKGGLSWSTWDDAERQACEILVQSGDILLLTGPAAWRLGPLYLSLGDVETRRVGNQALTPYREWVAEWVEVDPPPGTLYPATRSWGDIIAAGLTWDDLRRMTWLDAMYPPGGFPDTAFVLRGWP